MPTPRIMTHPELLRPGEAWEHDCTVLMAGTLNGVYKTERCKTRTQGGFAGFRAHQKVVHGIEPPAA